MKNDPLTKQYNEKLAKRLNEMWEKQGIDMVARVVHVKPSKKGWGHWCVRSDAVVNFKGMK